MSIIDDLSSYKFFVLTIFNLNLFLDKMSFKILGPKRQERERVYSSLLLRYNFYTK